MRWLLLVFSVAQAIAADDSLEHSDAFAQCAADPASCTSLYVPAALHPAHVTPPRQRTLSPHLHPSSPTWPTPGACVKSPAAPQRYRPIQGCWLVGGCVGSREA
jgi:hypothetical protein